VHRTQRTRNKRKSCASTNSSNQTGIATLPRAYRRPRPSIRAYSSIIRRLLPTKPRLINKIHRILRNLVFVGALHATSIISIQTSIATSPPASHRSNSFITRQESINNRVLPTNKRKIYKIYHIRSTVVGCIHKTAIHLRLNLLLLLVDQTCLVNPRTTSAIGRRMIRRSPRISFWRIQRPMNNSTEKCPCFCTEVYPFGLQGCTPSDCSRKSNAK